MFVSKTCYEAFSSTCEGNGLPNSGLSGGAHRFWMLLRFLVVSGPGALDHAEPAATTLASKVSTVTFSFTLSLKCFEMLKFEQSHNEILATAQSFCLCTKQFNEQSDLRRV
ncbi:hypothetical protein L596_026180 [Steinernema carpocapsae]|uniref:Uncharacterized protein n=1 Tax=Steinernema carpocapsae TaxID=34508 RepID=A0A4U5M0N0_STECR|nr:hypothetical protein L596_026180 [Steinernema carpocapsae]